MLMPNGEVRIVGMTAEKKGRNVAKINKNVVETDVMLSKTVIMTAYAKELKMLVTDADQILNHTMIIAEPGAKIANVSDKLTAMDLLKVIELAITATILAFIVIVADIS
jgi:hypothetical protein